MHKPGYMRLILNYKTPEDSLKLLAAYYLLNNLDNNYSVIRFLTDSAENDICINTDSFLNYTEIKNYIDSLEQYTGNLKYTTDSIWLDLQNIDPDFMIDHIDKSFKHWSTGYSRAYSFKDFLNYILPYRVANEEIEEYADNLLTKYGYLLNGDDSLINIANRLNSLINKKFTYDDRLEISPNPQGLSELEKTKRGNLLDLNIYKIKALRSLGIGAVLDYTVGFNDSTLGYYSTTAILPNNRKLHLHNPDNLINAYKINGAPKVYRRSFKENPECLFAIKDIKTHTPGNLGDFHYYDVTHEYLEIKDTILNFSDTNQFVYIAIDYDDKLLAVDWSSPDTTGKALFTKLGRGIFYTPVVLKDKELIKAGNRFKLK